MGFFGSFILAVVITVMFYVVGGMIPILGSFTGVLSLPFFFAVVIYLESNRR